MSSIDFASFLKSRMRDLGMGPTEAARISGLTRQTWHKLLRADVEEAKISTLRKLAKALRTSPEHLLYLYFQNGACLATRLMDQPPVSEPASYAHLYRLAERRDDLHSLRE